MKIFLTILLCLSMFIGKTQTLKADSLNTLLIEKYIDTILKDTSKRFKEYPLPPKLTKKILQGLKNEFVDDSVKYYFDHLSASKFKWSIDYTAALRYFKNNWNVYSILALTTHWNPDARVSALITLNEFVKLRPLFCTTDAGYKKLLEMDQASISFLLYILKSNPLFISGSENATIHEHYISNILWNLDLLTNEKIIGKQSFHEWYKNNTQFESAIQKWQAHIK
ncbi:MAG: hypothetical protein V4556_07890 [Bacteroidota bacterium]